MAEAQTKTTAGLSQAHQIVKWQWCIAAVGAILLPPLAMALGLLAGESETLQSRWVAAGLSMLLGSTAIVAPNWLYARMAGTEHSASRLLALAGGKLLVTLALLVLAMIVASRLQGGLPAWTLGGVALAYISHAFGAFRS